MVGDATVDSEGEGLRGLPPAEQEHNWLGQTLGTALQLAEHHALVARDEIE